MGSAFQESLTFIICGLEFYPINMPWEAIATKECSRIEKGFVFTIFSTHTSSVYYVCFTITDNTLQHNAAVNTDRMEEMGLELEMETDGPLF